MFKRFFRFFFVFVLSMSVLCASALADVSYQITNYSMTVDVQTDGSALVSEMLIYQFDGEYNGILSQFDTEGLDSLEDLCIYIDGRQMTQVEQMNYDKNTYTLSEEGSLLKVQVYSPGDDDTRLVTYEYRMEGLAKRYEDTGVIFRKFIGENNAVRLQNASVIVRFPRRASIQAFAHGSMDMSHVTIGEDNVQFGPATVYSGDYAEMRLLFPAALLADAPEQEGKVLQTHLDAEETLDAEARQRAARIKSVKYGFSGIYTALFGLIWLLMGKKYQLKGGLHQTADICRLSKFPSAFAAVAANEAPDTNALSGTLLELVQKGLVLMQNEADDIRFTRTAVQPNDLASHQEQLLTWLFDEHPSLLLSELNAGSDYEQAQKFETEYAVYCDRVMEDMTGCGLKYKNDGVRIAANALMILLGVAGIGYTLLAGSPMILLGAGLLLMMFLFVYLMSRIRSLTDEGELLSLDAKALLEKEIRPDDDLSTLLPYYTALGMTEPLVQALEGRRLDNSVWNEPDYMGKGWHLNVRHLSDSMRDTHYHNASVPNPDASSSHYSGSSSGGGSGHGAW